MKRSHVLAFVAGIVFALGLGISGMTSPAKVIAFLDVTGHWDPSLALVMVSAVGVYAASAWATRSAKAPRFASSFLLPPSRGLDARLFVGAGLFGVGWGIAGFCPGPAVVSLVTLQPTTLSFVGSMLVGMVAHALLEGRRTALGLTDQRDSVTLPR